MNYLTKEKTDVVSIFLDECDLIKDSEDHPEKEAPPIPADRPGKPDISAPLQDPVREPDRNPKIRVLNIES